MPRRSAPAPAARGSAPRERGVPGCLPPFPKSGWQAGLQNRAPSPANSFLHVSQRDIPFAPSGRALSVEIARRSVGRPIGLRRHRRRHGGLPQHAGLIRPPAVLRAISLRHPPHLEIHVGPPCRPGSVGHLIRWRKGLKAASNRRRRTSRAPKDSASRRHQRPGATARC